MQPLDDVLPRTLALIEEGIRAGQHIGAQLYVSRHGQPIADAALGEARPGVPLSTDTLMPWLSATKPLVAMAVMQLVERQRLALDEPVVEHLPEFTGGGKEQITVRHILTHTAGLEPVNTAVDTPRQDILAEIYRSSLPADWAPGQRARYDASSGWHVLGELVEQLSGVPFEKYVRREICEPLNMDDCWLALAPQQYEKYGQRLGIMHTTQRRNAPPAPAESAAEFMHAAPGKSGRGPMRQLARFYESLLAHIDAHRSPAVALLTPAAAQAMIDRQRRGLFDETFRAVVDWGLGLLLDSKQYGEELVPYGYGRHASPGSFGHSGNQSSSAFADPAYGLVVALVFNGMCGEPRHQQRVHGVLTALYEDLGLADNGGSA